MRWRLKVSFQVHDERVVDNGEYVFLTLDMINLFQFDDCTLFEALESERVLLLVITSVLDEAHATESSRSKRRQYMKVV